MFIEIVLIIVGLALVVFGADWLVDGASAVARRSGISEFVIGLTIVGFGTSCPELVVSVTGAIQGNGDIAVGNVLGSNIFNTLLILGLTAAIRPVAITDSNRRRDIPVVLLVTLLAVALGMNKTIFGLGDADCLDRVEGIVFLLLFAAYMYMCFKCTPKDEFDSNGADSNKGLGLWAGLGLSLVGIAALVVGGRLFVDNSVLVAHRLNLSDKFIAITLLACGTSLPELATCIVAAVKGRQQLALGNVLGSNVFNVLLILGCSACISPISFASINIVDLSVFAASSLLLLLSASPYDKKNINRIEGVIFLLLFAAYYVWLFINH